MWKLYLSLFLAKTVKLIINILNIGSGFTWPGHVALTIYPEILKNKRFGFPQGIVLVSGTNGKTTTTKLLTHILEYSGLRVIHNKTGANLLNGIVSEILLSMDILGNHNSDIGVFEVDENNLPLILEYINPTVLVLLNISRDQLDRYGETDLILDGWSKCVAKLTPSTKLILDGTQSYFDGVVKDFKGEIIRFDDNLTNLKNTKLVGKFNAKNINAAVYASTLVGVEEGDARQSLSKFESAYGRGELVVYKGKRFQLFLAKNPASFNNNLESLLDGSILCDGVWVVLNDDIPDGRDVSWIYDVDPKLLEKAFYNKEVFVSGSRYLDMGVRLNYANIKILPENLSMRDTDVLTRVNTRENLLNIVVLPNYSAMLNVRQLLTGRKIL